MKTKGISSDDYRIDELREVKSNVYLVVYKKDYGNKIKEGPPHKHFIVDATKDEQSASVRQISLPFDNDPKSL